MLLVVPEDVQSDDRLERELRLFLGGAGVPVINFPDWETPTATLFDYLPDDCLLIQLDGIHQQADRFMEEESPRYESRRYGIERPLLPPERLHLRPQELTAALKQGRSVTLNTHELPQRSNGYAGAVNFATRLPPPVALQARSGDPAAALKRFLGEQPQVLFIAESAGRREMLLGPQPRRAGQ